jgi:hypothetical protein
VILRRFLALLVVLFLFGFSGCETMREMEAQASADRQARVTGNTSGAGNTGGAGTRSTGTSSAAAQRSGSVPGLTAQNMEAAPTIPDGFIRLILNENNGSFSLLYLAEPSSMRYVPLFNSRQPSASYLSVSFNGSVHRLGQSGAFRTRMERVEDYPAFIFESPSLTVTQVFTPIRTVSSEHVNGVMITITMMNTGTSRASIGLRMLIDTDLEDYQRRNRFLTSNRIITSETLIEGDSGERFWISRGQNIALMGSIVNPINPHGPVPDFVHFANWKRFNDTPWRLRYSEGRSFNNLPYSVRDSAVCYYFEPVPLDSGRSITHTIFLTTEDIAWYNVVRLNEIELEENHEPTVPPTVTPAVTPAAPVAVIPAPAAPTPPAASAPAVSAPAVSAPAVATTTNPVFAPTINIASIEEASRIEAEQNNEDPDMVTLLRLQEILNQFIAGELQLNEQDIGNIERAILRLRSRN